MPSAGGNKHVSRRRRGWLTIIALSRRCFGSWSASVSCRRQSFRVHKEAASERPQRVYASLALSGMACVVLASCAVGPDYVPPQAPMPANSRQPGPKRNARSDHHVADTTKWWRTLHDRELDSLIDRAIAASPTLEDRAGPSAAGACTGVRGHWLGTPNVGRERGRRCRHGNRLRPWPRHANPGLR